MDSKQLDKEVTFGPSLKVIMTKKLEDGHEYAKIAAKKNIQKIKNLL